MILPCCQEPTKENIKSSKNLINEYFKKTGKQYCLIVNTGGKLEVIPESSIELIKSLMPNIKLV